MARNPESELSDAIRDALAVCFGHCLKVYRNSVGGFRNGGRVYHAGLPTGSADLICVLRVRIATTSGEVVELGRFVALEVKTRTGKVKPEQEDWLQSVRAHGGFATVVRSTEEAIAAIHRAQKGALS